MCGGQKVDDQPQPASSLWPTNSELSALTSLSRQSLFFSITVRSVRVLFFSRHAAAALLRHMARSLSLWFRFRIFFARICCFRCRRCSLSFSISCSRSVGDRFSLLFSSCFLCFLFGLSFASPPKSWIGGGWWWRCDVNRLHNTERMNERKMYKKILQRPRSHLERGAFLSFCCTGNPDRLWTNGSFVIGARDVGKCREQDGNRLDFH